MRKLFLALALLLFFAPAAEAASFNDAAGGSWNSIGETQIKLVRR